MKSVKIMAALSIAAFAHFYTPTATAFGPSSPYYDAEMAMKDGKYERVLDLLVDKVFDDDDAKAQYLFATAIDQLDPSGEDSVDYFEMSAKNGFADAKYALGMKYLKGFGVEKNLETAKAYLKDAGQTGSAEAREALKGLE